VQVIVTVGVLEDHAIILLQVLPQATYVQQELKLVHLILRCKIIVFAVQALDAVI